jgi:hypothetical protein
MIMMVRISPTDEAALDWYFGPGSALFERSTMGGMLDRASLFSLPYLPDPELVLARLHRLPHEPPPGEVTARPTGHSYQAGGYTPDEGALNRYAYISRILSRVGRAAPFGLDVLSAYYGDQGARWGRTRHGRLFSVYPLTEAGKELLRRARKRTKGADLGLCAAEELAAVFEVQAVQPMPARRLLGEQARREATKHYERACALWVEVRHG